VSPVYVWDQRNPQVPLLQFVESHTDTVTDLQLHPDFPTLLLSASTDGLINIFDVSKPDEEDALYQVINHKSAVARAGFMYPTTDIFAMGTDETLSFYALQSQTEEQPEPTPKAYGDVREQFNCEYLAKMHWVGKDAYIATGKHRYIITIAYKLDPMIANTSIAQMISPSFPYTRIRVEDHWITFVIKQIKSLYLAPMGKKSFVICSPIFM
jgi:WD40 repeat protein